MLFFLAVPPGSDDKTIDEGRAQAGAADPRAQTGELDELSSALFAAFRQALLAHRQFMARSLGDADLHPGQAVCLNVLARAEGMSQRALADTMHVAPPTLSRMLRALEKGGLVERRQDASDQRLTRVHLTPAGHDVAVRTRRALAAHIPAAIAALSLDERRELARLLDKLTASIASSLRARPGKGEERRDACDKTRAKPAGTGTGEGG